MMDTNHIDTSYYEDHPYYSEGDANTPCVDCDSPLMNNGYINHASVDIEWVKRQEWYGPVENGR